MTMRECLFGKKCLKIPQMCETWKIISPISQDLWSLYMVIGHMVIYIYGQLRSMNSMQLTYLLLKINWNRLLKHWECSIMIICVHNISVTKDLTKSVYCFTWFLNCLHGFVLLDKSGCIAGSYFRYHVFNWEGKC